MHLISWGPKARTVALYAHDGRLTGVVGFSAAAAVMRLRADITAGTAGRRRARPPGAIRSRKSGWNHNRVPFGASYDLSYDPNGTR